MPSRSPARFLAPLALLAAVLTVFLVARPELESEPEPSSGTSSGTSSTATTGNPKPSGSSTTRSTATRKAAPKTYTVQPGDTLGAISEETSVAVADLLAYNDVDAANLRVGQKLKLAP